MQVHSLIISEIFDAVQALTIIEDVNVLAKSRLTCLIGFSTEGYDVTKVKCKHRNEVHLAMHYNVETQGRK